jgi:hypothetical protein
MYVLLDHSSLHERGSASMFNAAHVPGSGRLEAGGWRLEAGGWRLEAGE